MPCHPTFFSLQLRNILVTHQDVPVTFYNKIALMQATNLFEES